MRRTCFLGLAIHVSFSLHCGSTTQQQQQQRKNPTVDEAFIEYDVKSYSQLNMYFFFKLLCYNKL